jgi:hypothetical protein
MSSIRGWMCAHLEKFFQEGLIIIITITTIDRDPFDFIYFVFGFAL